MNFTPKNSWIYLGGTITSTTTTNIMIATRLIYGLMSKLQPLSTVSSERGPSTHVEIAPSYVKVEPRAIKALNQVINADLSVQLSVIDGSDYYLFNNQSFGLITLSVNDLLYNYGTELTRDLSFLAI